jgi:phosphoribosyl 1,2-cyclic phosphate phosphodiesterase
VRGDNAAFLIDTPPEMRIAAIEYGIDRVDAVCLTHAHMDHVSGFDDVRRFNTINGGSPMRCYAMAETIDQMHRIFPYITDRKNELGLFRPMINFVDNHEPFAIGSMKVERLDIEHGFPCCGYLIDGKIGYICDCHAIPDGTVDKLKGVEVMVLNCLRKRPHPTHLDYETARGYLERIAPGRAYLVHMCHDISHAQWLSELPAGIEPAYDGLELVV